MTLSQPGVRNAYVPHLSAVRRAVPLLLAGPGAPPGLPSRAGAAARFHDLVRIPVPWHRYPHELRQPGVAGPARAMPGGMPDAGEAEVAHGDCGIHR